MKILNIINVFLFFATLYTFFRYDNSAIQNYDLNDPIDQKKLAISFVDNFNQAKPISPIAADDLSEKNA